jgi:hypothetical protein
LNMMLTASAVNPDPLSRRYKEDLEREMTRLNIVSDKLTDNQEPQKLKGGIEHQHHVGFVDDPAMDEIDSVRKHMQNFRTAVLNQAEYNRIASHMDRYRHLYSTPSNAKAEPRFLMTANNGERNPLTGLKEFNGLVAEW